MKIPVLANDKFLLITADLKTGIILNNDGSFYIGNGEEYYIVFDKKSSAIEYAENCIKKNNEVEIMLYDGKGEFMQLFKQH